LRLSISMGQRETIFTYLVQCNTDRIISICNVMSPKVAKASTEVTLM
jgi:hypothetical protein